MYQEYKTKTNYIGLLVFITCLCISFKLVSGIFIIIPLCLGLIMAVSAIIFKLDHPIVIINILLVILTILDTGKFLPTYLNLRYTMVFIPLILYFSINKTQISMEEISLLALVPILGLVGSIKIADIAILLTVSGLAFIIAKYEIKTRDLENKYYSYYSRSSEEKYKLEKLYQSLSLDQNDRIENAILSERNRISRDIHDGLGHLTSRAILQLGAMIVVEKDPDKKVALNEIKDTLSEGMVEVRKSLHNLQSESINLKTEIEKLLADFTFCKVNFSYGLTSDFDMNFKYSLLYIIKEALTNVAKHSNANLVNITLVEMKNATYLKISDNGSGALNKESGMGLFSIKKRIEELGGRLEISTIDGFRIFATIDKYKQP
ncbi:sensor histidine kinase [Peptostreptococcus stomatis]|uniref:sensor histidine kinase n=1 Tax=Peptostreptococcus stomatis TaxID=341694 RepID=UPI0028E9B356|nr:histidine kinase [Peptostreptococcus stomatis]